MSSTAMNIQLTEQAYLEDEVQALIKHEYIEGAAYAMAGGSKNHNLISGNIFAEFRQQLKGKTCSPFIADMKVKAGANIYYPDVITFGSIGISVSVEEIYDRVDNEDIALFLAQKSP